MNTPSKGENRPKSAQSSVQNPRVRVLEPCELDSSGGITSPATIFRHFGEVYLPKIVDEKSTASNLDQESLLTARFAAEMARLALYSGISAIGDLLSLISQAEGLSLSSKTVGDIGFFLHEYGGALSDLHVLEDRLRRARPMEGQGDD